MSKKLKSTRSLERPNALIKSHSSFIDRCKLLKEKHILQEKNKTYQSDTEDSYKQLIFLMKNKKCKASSKDEEFIDEKDLEILRSDFKLETNPESINNVKDTLKTSSKKSDTVNVIFKDKKSLNKIPRKLSQNIQHSIEEPQIGIDLEPSKSHKFNKNSELQINELSLPSTSKCFNLQSSDDDMNPTIKAEHEETLEKLALLESALDTLIQNNLKLEEQLIKITGVESSQTFIDVSEQTISLSDVKNDSKKKAVLTKQVEFMEEIVLRMQSQFAEAQKGYMEIAEQNATFMNPIIKKKKMGRKPSENNIF